jgi:serine/threonine protein kinase
MFVCGECGQRYDDRGGYCPADGTPLVATDDPLLGTEVGRYRLSRLLGEGGMGRVYLAVQPVIGSRVAVKILSDQCAHDPELLDRFFAEARAVNLIRHENIVSVIDLSTLPDGRPFIVMEYIEGQTLGELVRGPTLPLGGVVQVMTEMLSALGAAHAIGIIHRDLKPDNVLVTGEGHAKVLDFGIAKLAPSLQAALSPRTRTGALLGTPAYMAPEQITGSGQVDARTDLYAAGVVLFEVVTGRAPFMHATLFDLMKAHMEESPPRPRSIRGDLPADMEAVILQALAKHPSQRFQSAAEMTQALHDAASQLSADQWRALSSRAGGMMSKPQPTPSRLVAGGRTGTPDLRVPFRGGPSVATVAASPKANAKTERDRKRRWPMVVVLLAVAVITTVIVIVSVQRGGNDTPLEVVADNSPTLVPVPPSPSPVDKPVVDKPVVDKPVDKHEPDEIPRVIEKNHGIVIKRRDPKPADKPADTKPPAGGPTPGEHEVAPPPGVHVEGNVHFIETTPGAQKSRPADYTAKRFDPLAYLPKATALARELMDDAQLTGFEFDPVYPDGHVDITSGRSHEYDFRSPSRSKRPAGTPKNLKLDQACLVHVELEPSQAIASVRNSETCTENIVRVPHCTFGQLFALAKAQGKASDDIVVRIAWLFDEKWFFDTDPDTLGKGGGVNSFADRCP